MFIIYRQSVEIMFISIAIGWYGPKKFTSIHPSHTHPIPIIYPSYTHHIPIIIYPSYTHHMGISYDFLPDPFITRWVHLCCWVIRWLP